MKTISFYHLIGNKTSGGAFRVEHFGAYFYIKENIIHGINVFANNEKKYLWKGDVLR